MIVRISGQKYYIKDRKCKKCGAKMEWYPETPDEYESFICPKYFDRGGKEHSSEECQVKLKRVA
jgi:hypothetical protein